MHVLFLAGWSDPFGDFTKEHCHAIAIHCNVSYIFIEFIKSNRHLPFKITVEFYTEHNTDHYFVKIYSPIRRFNIYNYLIKRSYSQVIKRIQKRKKIDICHINTRTPITEMVPFIKIIKDVPIVVSENSTFYHYGIYNSFQGAALEKEISRVSQWLSNSRFKFILPVSDQLGNCFVNTFNVSPAKIKTIPNVAAPEFNFVPKKTDSKIIIMLAAIWENQKNPMLFARALKLLPPHILDKLTILWIGEGSQLKEVKDFIADNLQNVDIRFKGLVKTRREMANYYQQAHIFVHPTNAENLPCVIVECLCCGTPAISNNINGVTEMLNDSNGLLSPVKDDHAMFVNLQFLITNLHKYNNQEIANAAQALYYPEAVGRQFISIYNKALISH